VASTDLFEPIQACGAQGKAARVKPGSHSIAPSRRVTPEA